uniref:Uncharacterized protein n=2 Tax=Caenorhabditis japonica TaxID=281687 RepID=A0A8R1IDK4_CAEJA
MNFLSRAADLGNTLTDKMLLKIREFRPQNIKQDIKTIRDRIQVLSSLSPLTTTERLGLDQLERVLLEAKNKLNERRKVEEKLKTDIEQTNGVHRLKNFPFAYETTFQLVCSYRVLFLLLKPDFGQMSERLSESARALYEKIESLPPHEKELIGVGWNHLRTINQSFSILLSQVDFLTATIPNEDHSLKHFGSLLSFLDHLNVSSLNFSLMIRTLAMLKTTSIGQTLEVANFGKSLEQLKDVQFWDMRKKGILPLCSVKLIHFSNCFSQNIQSQKLTDYLRFWLSLLLLR